MNTTEMVKKIARTVQQQKKKSKAKKMSVSESTLFTTFLYRAGGLPTK